MTDLLGWAGRLSGAALLGATAGIHAHLYATGYRQIPKIGPMFLALVVLASLLCLAVLATPGRLLAATSAVGALLQIGTFVGLVVFTHVTIFDFRESSQAPYYWDSVSIELAGFVVLTAVAAGVAVRRRSPLR